MKLEKYIQEEDLFFVFEEANLSPNTTGLSKVIYVSTKGNSKYFVRIKDYPKRGNKLKADSLITITISDNPIITGEVKDLTSKELE